jgi:(1->4)-alpha-D-glucan 1-alpha-D-glucosylmutase
MPDVIDTLVAQTAEEVQRRRSLPESTYRLQFHKGFTFRDARRIVPYLRDLGVTHCYASPYLKATPGSLHGYNIIDHRQLNPEIGTEDDYNAWVEALHAHGLRQVFDMVPNHMGILGNENLWWNDVLENGPASPFAAFFDISWHSSHRPELWGRVLLPILGSPYGKALEAQEIRLSYADGAFTLNYYDHRFPVDPRSYALILNHRLEGLRQALAPDDPALLEYESILTAVKHVPLRTQAEPARVAERQREKEVIKRRLTALTQESAPVRDFLGRTVAEFNGKAGAPRSFDLLGELLSEQAYRLSFWRVASDEINYRRFFDVNELAALSAEREEVFTATHELVLRLLREGKIDGLRIDHPDGLFDPKQYLERVQAYYALACARAVFDARAEYRTADWAELERPLLERFTAAVRAGADGPLARPLYLVVEKILGAAEPLPENWPVYGTTGYEFLNLLNGLFVDAANEKAFTRLYQDWIDDHTSFAEIVYQKKLLILRVTMSSELHMLAHQLDRLAQKNRFSRDFTLNTLRHALREVIACFPVYRSYISDEGLSEMDRKYIIRAVRRARTKNPALSGAIFDFVRDMLLLKYPAGSTAEEQAEQRRFAGKFQQVTSPVMAKGLEDTAFYVYNRLVSLNEVGGDPDRFGLAPAALHKQFQERQAKWPWSLAATSTHDTKRSEDVRARIDVLSELPGEWKERLARWSEMNRPHRVQLEEEEVAPDLNEEYLTYQTLLGAWPLTPCGAEEYAEFVKRIQAYLVKALHEAKVHTSWVNPNAEYDDAIQQFVARILDEGANRAFLQDFCEFQRWVSHYGLFNGLSQALLKITAPGVADTYQGAELWDLSLVDPDNRRPVDYGRRAEMLRDLRERVAAAGNSLAGFARELTLRKEDGRIKLYVTSRGLQCRREHPGLFAAGEYLPAEASGARAEQVFGFARRRGDVWAVVAVPRLLTRLIGPGEVPLGPAAWQDTVLLLPGVDPALKLRNVYTGERLAFAEREGKPCLHLAEVFASFPVALFEAALP